MSAGLMFILAQAVYPADMKDRGTKGRYGKDTEHIALIGYGGICHTSLLLWYVCTVENRGGSFLRVQQQPEQQRPAFSPALRGME